MYSEKANRAYYVGNGRCPRCGGRNPLAPGMKTCRECADKVNAGRRARTQRRRESGLCTRCGKPLPEGSRYVQCEACRAYQRPFQEFKKERYEGLKDAGKCVKCMVRWAEPGRTLCRECREAWHRNADKATYAANKRRRRQEYREAGLCIDCGRPVDGDGHTRCRRCRDLRMDSTRKYRILKRLDREAEHGRNKGTL